MRLHGKQPITDFSYRAEDVRKLEKAGGIIMDIVTSGRGSEELRSWADWFRSKDEPCFAARKMGNSGDINLWIARTVDHDGKEIPRPEFGV